MTIALNDTIVPGRDKEAAACFFAQLFWARPFSASCQAAARYLSRRRTHVHTSSKRQQDMRTCAHPSGGIAHHGDLRRAVGAVLSLVAGCMFGPGSRPFFK
jgi:hypothetical protein